jgi:hypothetical protein
MTLRIRGWRMTAIIGMDRGLPPPTRGKSMTVTPVAIRPSGIHGLASCGTGIPADDRVTDVSRISGSTQYSLKSTLYSQNRSTKQERAIAKQKNTFAKRERENEKRRKADEKRARRTARKSGDAPPQGTVIIYPEIFPLP